MWVVGLKDIQKSLRTRESAQNLKCLLSVDAGRRLSAHTVRSSPNRN